MSKILPRPVVAIPPACMHGISDHVSSTRPKETHLLDEERHWESLVEQPQLSALALLVLGIPEDSTVEERAVDVGNHGSDVSRRVGLAVRGVLDTVEVLLGGPASRRSGSVAGTRATRWSETYSWKKRAFPSLKE
jgi:hypothetical protein